MESCETCDQLPSAVINATTVTCNGTCGRSVHASSANVSGIILSSDNNRYWYCDRCQLKLCPMARKRSASPVADASRKLTKREGFPDLPSEMLIEIFRLLLPSQLLQARLVCRHWRDIVDGTGSLLAKLTLSFPDHAVFTSDYFPEHLFPAIKVHLSWNKITAVGTWWPPLGERLIGLKISCIEISLPNFLFMLKHTPNLKCLELFEICLIGDLSVVADFRLDQVEKLTLDYPNTSKVLEVLRGICCNVKCLRVTWDDYGRIDLISPLQLTNFVGGQQNTLTELFITCTDEILQELTQLKRLKLKRLTLTGEPLSTEYRYSMELCRKHPSLEYLNIRDVFDIFPAIGEVKAGIFEQLPELKFLAFKVGADRVDLSFLSGLAKLQSFSLYGYDCDNEFISLNSRVPQMRKLTLTAIRFPGISFHRCLVSMPNLSTLTIEDCKFESWSCLLKPLGQLKCLKNLSLTTIQITDSTRCPFDCLESINYLHFNWDQMPEDTLNKILNLCPHLRELHSKSMKPHTINEGVLRVIYPMLSNNTFVHNP